ncbi:hypothetical protein JOC86_002003 [Bacillus pakistanensis]|uniref:Uncharacterized protein n=1 Tax=Rossellomorea pakistanensis TaxID=992288 RepID=A0ABS2ND15_9BACI|nr:hypothetical protein [Bacillus pakistanensis]
MIKEGLYGAMKNRESEKNDKKKALLCHEKP